ncbi:MAG: phytoene/squalene synthase family protein [Chitinophagales bacterium]
MKTLYDQVSRQCSRLITRQYSTSFSLGIWFLEKPLREPIYSIYGMVRLADEIVDSFQDYPRADLLARFKADTFDAIQQRVSLNPVLHAFQETVHRYGISAEWISLFFESMQMDLHPQVYDQHSYERYILGSAEVVGLMCLHVFTEGNQQQFDVLKPYAMRLGAAFQKVNFLRDVKADKNELGRTYFPQVNLNRFTEEDKRQIEADIEADFREAVKGILLLPNSSRRGVFLAYYYYFMLFRKIQKLPPKKILEQRIRIHNFEKFLLLFRSDVKLRLHLM